MQGITDTTAQAGTTAGEQAHAGACLNCAAPLTGRYCANCGQSAHVHRSVGAFGHDLVHGVLHLDGKFWRTMPLLALKPGELTRRYIDGERARFVSPLGLFLFSIFLLFAVLALTGGSGIKVSDSVKTEMAAEMAVREARLKAQRAALEAGEPVPLASGET